MVPTHHPNIPLSFLAAAEPPRSAGAMGDGFFQTLLFEGEAGMQHASPHEPCHITPPLLPDKAERPVCRVALLPCEMKLLF